MLSAVLAQAATEEPAGFDIFGLLLPLLLAFLLFSMFSRQRKAQKQVKEMRTQMEPGTEVMTQFGLFGTIVSIDQENNKAVLELSPGNHATVHTQALTKVVLQDTAAVVDDPDEADSASEGRIDSTTVPDDVSSIDGTNRPTAGGSSAAGAPVDSADVSGSDHDPYGTEQADSSPTAQNDRDALDPRDPGTKRDN